MIELIVEPYCHNCPSFEATQNTLWAPESIHTITCKRAQECDTLASYLRGQIEKGETQNEQA